ncbi:hypothetical protein AAEX28_01680 [Lentisphaerota bacterium WC36G]|nr:hypothetical protein LJT99_04565 [Lentisphaerae bacterium WC36]
MMRYELDKKADCTRLRVMLPKFDLKEKNVKKIQRKKFEGLRITPYCGCYTQDLEIISRMPFLKSIEFYDFYDKVDFSLLGQCDWL